ncbi:MAG TPA: sigma-54 dependent transcriptional regulator [Acidobacteriaceae bacterium]|jgi:DNA-binding NtrC family response regulator|nr:sigma-54 dependent transcriptional regulator [Acidobacteriaceae bacterium]
MAISIVILDDNPGSLELLSTALARDGVIIHAASRPSQALALVEQVRPHLVLTDLVMPEMTGLDVLSRIMAMAPATDVVLMTAHYTTETAVQAIRTGAADYLEKPIRLTVLRERVGRLIADAERRLAAGSDAEFEGLIGSSPRMAELFARIRRIAPHYRSALIQGATGTGKDLVARALHVRSGVKGQYVVLNCSAVVETLFESELFGHVRGAFTGADRDKPGLFEAASEGTLFLDEIGDMPLATQSKLLRALQNQEIQRVGSLQTRKVNVRVVAATHRNLRQAVADRHFREDLYYRLAMVEIPVPALAERKEDLPLLIRHFIDRFAHQYGKNIRSLTPRARLLLERHSWPGNVRELENVLGHACMMAESTEIDVADLPSALVGPSTPTPVQERAPTPLSGPGSPAADLQEDASLAEHERQLVVSTLEKAQGNQSQAARALGIGRDALRYKMKKYGLL